MEKQSVFVDEEITFFIALSSEVSNDVIENESPTPNDDEVMMFDFSDESIDINHYSLDQSPSVHEGKKPYKCSICDYNCSQKDSLTKHV